MDANTINARIYAGRAQVAARLGYPVRVFRPVDALNPLANAVSQLMVVYHPEDGRYDQANGYGKSAWYAEFAAGQAREGDYLVAVGAVPGAPFAQPETGPQYSFIAARQSLLPVLAIACNAFVRISRPMARAAGAAGATGYGGIGSAGMVDVLGSGAAGRGGWPCALLLGGGSARLKDPLPAGAAQAAGWMVCLPPSVPVALLAGDRMIDQTGRVLVIEAAELTSLGYRLQASEAHD